MKKNNERWRQAQESWLEMVTMAPELLAWWFDAMRGAFLQAGDIFLAARTSIYLIVVLTWIGWEDDIPKVVDDLRSAVRKAGRHGEMIFALYALTNAMERGEDPEDAAEDALARLERCEQASKRNHFSSATEGAGDHERRSSMKTQQVVQTQEQELKAERVQEGLMLDDPFRLSLKAERVQEPASVAGAAVPLATAFELSVNQAQPVTIELFALGVIITLHGPNAGAAGLAQ